MQLEIEHTKRFEGDIDVPGDKSITHRAVMLASIADGESVIENYLSGDDCLRTLECFRAMGVDAKSVDQHNGWKLLSVKGRGLKGLAAPKDILYVGNSGTSIRLLLGILAGQEFASLITGDESIKQRPMLRVVEPLRKMGAVIAGRENGKYAPIEIKGGKLHSIEYRLPVASAQIKSCLMLAALYAEGITKITEPAPSRDHTEKMFDHFKIPYEKIGNTISLSSPGRITAANVHIPGDISSAAFFMVGASIIPGANVRIRNVGLNPTRTGIIDVLLDMGADIEIEKQQVISGELRGNIIVRHSKLKGVEISGDIIPRLIDEIPIIAVAAAAAEGNTVISDAKELRVKESDRIKVMAQELGKIGVTVDEKEDGMVIHGGASFKNAVCNSHGDHRVAMSLAIAGLASKEGITIENTECIETSFPGFEELITRLI